MNILENTIISFFYRFEFRVLVVLAAGSHPIPFRTRKLSPPAPMVAVLVTARVGRCRDFEFKYLTRLQCRRFFCYIFFQLPQATAFANGAARVRRCRD